ncbi:helix-turn-helix domain-containing protein [Rhodococcus sp. NPDC019627]|uniref:helix-turn-helix domain-containing protein n=1 Tax=unclassified Rhodococcus (in: high G+C Gram-positive bacteria) TaxID=192944 RepID=UPI0033D7E3FC
MNKTGQTRIWNVGYPTTRPAIEVLSLADLRARALRAREEFLRPQRVHFELLIAVTGGTLHHTVDFVGHHLHPGDVLWIRAGQVQEWEWFDDDVMTQPAEVAATIVLFEPTSVDEQARALCDPRSFWPATATAQSPAWRYLDDLVAAADRTLPRRMHEELMGRVLSLLIVELALTDPVENAPQPDAGNDLFTALTAAIDRDYATTRTTSDYARQLGYSSRTLNRCALRNTGSTVKQLVDQRALLEAKRLLAHDTRPVQAVGRAVGFDEPTTFNRFFRQRTGMTPLEFRTARAAPSSRAKHSQ